jgi:hypothetical protein
MSYLPGAGDQTWVHRITLILSAIVRFDFLFASTEALKKFQGDARVSLKGLSFLMFVYIDN